MRAKNIKKNTSFLTIDPYSYFPLIEKEGIIVRNIVERSQKLEKYQ
jgi:hypothetical protein